MPESRGAELVPCTGATAVLAAVRSGAADAGCVPIENTVEGSVAAVLDGLVEDPPLVIVREAQLAVHFAVMVRPGTSAQEVKTVASHGHGLAQTRRWIARHLPDAETVVVSSTAEAAAQVARGTFDAAVAAPIAAEQHGLVILADDVADTAGAVTRFVLVTPPCPPPAPTGFDRTTIAATTENRPGSLHEVLGELAIRGIDLTRIESRPIKDRPAEYWFHFDCAGHVAEPMMGEALAALHRRCDRVRFLGSYPRANGPLPARSVTAEDRVRNNRAYEAAQRWLADVRAGRTA